MSRLVGILLVALIICMLFGIFANVWSQVDATHYADTEKQLRTIAEITLANNSDQDLALASEDSVIASDSWGTEIRLLYLRVPDKAVAVALSAGRDGIWETDDDVAAVAIGPGHASPDVPE